MYRSVLLLRGKDCPHLRAAKRTMYSGHEKERAQYRLCGGARTFGVAIQNAVLEILQQGGGDADADDGRMDETAATTFLQELVRSGRYHEDLSD